MIFPCGCGGRPRPGDKPCGQCCGSGFYRLAIEECRKCPMPVLVSRFGLDDNIGWSISPIIDCENSERCGEKIGGKVLWGTVEAPP